MKKSKIDIVPETINRIRLSDNDLILLQSVLCKIDKSSLNKEEKDFHCILLARTNGRLKLRKENPDL